MAPSRSINSGSSAVIDAGSSIAFKENISDQMKADVIHSTLFAQVAANHKYDRQTQAAEWYDFYKNVLEHVGWMVDRPNLSKVGDAATYRSVDNLLSKLSASYLTASELELLNTTIKSLKDSKNEKARNLFDSSSKSSKQANFQVGIADDQNGNATVKMTICTYTASTNIDKVLFYQFGSQKVDFYYGNLTMVLNSDVYAQVRQVVLDKLGDNLDLVHNIEL